MSQQQSASPYWDMANDIAKIREQRKIESGQIRLPDTEALRKYAESLKEPVPKIVNSIPLTEQVVAEVMYRRAQILMFIKSKDVHPYVVDDHNRSILTAIKLYALRDKRFESEGYGMLHKGLMLRGLQGCGKTMILRMLADVGPLQRHDGIVHSISELKQRGWGDMVKLGIYNLSDFYSCVSIEHEYRQKDGEKYVDSIRRINRPLVFDDLGFERSETMNFGNRVNIMEGLIQSRYDMFVNQGIATHFSTNLVNSDEMEKVYGPRIRSRIREMCNVFTFESEDGRHIDRRK